MSEEPRTVRQYALDAGLSPERIEQHFTEGCLRLDGEVVTDLDTPIGPDSRVNAWGS